MKRISASCRSVPDARRRGVQNGRRDKLIFLRFRLQQFIEINAIGFRKILKKWDKRSKSNTKELYLERQVEVQPCFNREVRTLRSAAQVYHTRAESLLSALL